jgi:hypothetical protein
MHLVNILRIITFSFLVGHSILTISDFNGFRFFWDTLYRCNRGFLNTQGITSPANEMHIFLWQLGIVIPIQSMITHIYMPRF